MCNKEKSDSVEVGEVRSKKKSIRSFIGMGILLIESVWMALMLFCSPIYQKLDNTTIKISMFAAGISFLFIVLVTVYGIIRKKKPPMLFYGLMSLLICLISFGNACAIPHYVIRNDTLEYYSWLCFKTEFKISKGVKRIHANAFHWVDLETIVIPNSVEYIEPGAFEGCFSLRDIQLEDGNQYYVLDDGVLFSKDRKTLLCYISTQENTSYSIPNGVTTIAAYAFSLGNNLSDVYIPEGVTEIGDYAFCDSSLSSVALPDGLVRIGHSAFEWSKLESIDIPQSVEQLEPDAFTHCHYFSGVHVDADNRFYYSDSNGALYTKDMRVLLLSSGVSLTSEDRFEISKIAYSVPWGVEEIGANAWIFAAQSVESITLPETVTKIGENVFEQCTSLQTVHFGGTEKQRNQIILLQGNDPLKNAEWNYNE